MAERLLLLGDEAIALAAVHAGISGAYSYPGTPASEIFEYVEGLADRFDIHAAWSANEKVAYEEALGMSFAGKRALVSMKHVGLNVAADPFVNSAISGVNGGLVLAVADDPGMHSSQNEQDSRYYANFARIPCLEPANQQEAYEMTSEAFELSERFGLPIMVRLTTRLAHSRADVAVGEPRGQNSLKKPSDVSAWTLLPGNARRQYRKLLEKRPALLEASEASPYNVVDLSGPDRGLGVIASGIAYNYFMEAVGGVSPYPYVKIGMYPLPVSAIRRLYEAVERMLVIEEGYPFIEELMSGVVGCGKPVLGKLSGALPRTGELRPELVAGALGIQWEVSEFAPFEPLAARPPALCKGCPHADTFRAMQEAISIYEQPTVFSDIGCYTLGFYPPFQAIETCIDMGASIGMAAGAAHAGMFPVLCAIGDSTFCHSGMTPLIGAAKENMNVKVFILDNGTVAMTGTQETMATGKRLVELVMGLGVPREHVRTLVPLPRNHEENVRLIREEIEYEGLSVLIPQRPCIHLKRKI